MDDHRHDGSLISLVPALTLTPNPLAFNQISQSGVFENSRRRVADIQKHLVQGAVFHISLNEAAKLCCISKRSEGTIDQADNLSQVDFRGSSAQPVAALSPADAFHHSRISQFHQDQLQKFLR